MPRRSCGPSRTCTEVTDEAAYCACTNPCTDHDATWCVGGTLYGCTPDNRECYSEQLLQVCTDSVMVCDETLSPPACATP